MAGSAIAVSGADYTKAHQSYVRWMDLNSQNLCLNKSKDIYTLWAEPLNLCTSNGTYIPPPQLSVYQGLIISACALGGIALLILCISINTRPFVAFISAAFSITTVVLIIAFLAYTPQFDYFARLLTEEGFFIPISRNLTSPSDTSHGNYEDLYVLGPVTMTLGPGWNATVFSLVGYILFSACIIAIGVILHNDENKRKTDRGEYGTGAKKV